MPRSACAASEPSRCYHQHIFYIKTDISGQTTRLDPKHMYHTLERPQPRIGLMYLRLIEGPGYLPNNTVQGTTVSG